MLNFDKTLSLAVLIDADNISPSLVEPIFKIATEIGEPIVRRAYGMVGCFSDGGGWQRAQREYGVVAKPQVSNVSGKNVADIALVIDAMELLFKGSCNGICIVSSKSTSVRVARRFGTTRMSLRLWYRTTGRCRRRFPQARPIGANWRWL